MCWQQWPGDDVMIYVPETCKMTESGGRHTVDVDGHGQPRTEYDGGAVTYSPSSCSTNAFALLFFLASPFSLPPFSFFFSLLVLMAIHSSHLARATQRDIQPNGIVPHILPRQTPTTDDGQPIVNPLPVSVKALTAVFVVLGVLILGERFSPTRSGLY